MVRLLDPSEMLGGRCGMATSPILIPVVLPTVSDRLRQAVAAYLARFTGQSRVHTQVKALTGLETLIAEVVQDMTAQREFIPDPLSERTYSGKLNPRVGEALHRRLAIEAAEEKLSINQLIVRLLNTAC
jgi:predicted HicB family RNase H-like nuclease